MFIEIAEQIRICSTIQPNINSSITHPKRTLISPIPASWDANYTLTQIHRGKKHNQTNTNTSRSPTLVYQALKLQSRYFNASVIDFVRNLLKKHLLLNTFHRNLMQFTVPKPIRQNRRSDPTKTRSDLRARKHRLTIRWDIRSRRRRWRCRTGGGRGAWSRSRASWGRGSGGWRRSRRRGRRGSRRRGRSRGVWGEFRGRVARGS